MISIHGRFSPTPVFCEQWSSRRGNMTQYNWGKFEIITCVEEYKILKKELAAKFEILPYTLSTILKNNAEIINNYETASIRETRQCGQCTL